MHIRIKTPNMVDLTIQTTNIKICTSKMSDVLDYL